MIDQTIIQTASLIVNGLVSLILLWTLFEIRNQRREAYMPDLLIKNHFFKIKKEKGYEFSWKSENSTSSDFLLSITNAGFGIAKNINLHWHYDIDKFVKLIQKLDTNNKFNLRRERNIVKLSMNNSKAMINLKCDPYFDSFLKIDNDMNVRLPFAYKELFSIFIFLLYQTPQRDSFETHINQVPKLKLKINHQDISGRKFIKRYGINIEVVLVKGSTKGEFILYQGLLKAR